MEGMSHLNAQLQLELSQAFLQAALTAGVARLDLPIKLLRFSLGRLSGGKITRCELTPEGWGLGVRFATGPALELNLRPLEYLPQPQTWRLRVEGLHFSGFSGAPLLNLAPARVLEALAAQANRRLPGLLATGKNLGLEVRMGPLLQRVLEEAPLGRVIRERLGLEPSPELRVERLELLEGKLGLALYGGV
jgi:hypothetical protein